jgi:hypothetical protein
MTREKKDALKPSIHATRLLEENEAQERKALN